VSVYELFERPSYEPNGEKLPTLKFRKILRQIIDQDPDADDFQN